MSSRAAVSAAVRIEDEVVYGYGIVGAHLGGARQRFAADRLAAHQQFRDNLQTAGHTTAGGKPAYELPFPVVNPVGAVSLAIRLEDGAAVAAYALVAASDPGGALRRLAVGMLADVAGAAARWRSLSGATDDPAFPGQPAAAAPSRQPSTTATTSPSSSTTASGSTS